ncbi:MAG: Mur ligase family protein, partial [Thermoplasmataceae archaeon]
ELIPDSYLEEFVETYRKIITELGQSKRNPTFFEVTTLLAFRYFADRKAQYASVEVGLGGRLDSTNIITPEVSVITQIGFEHADKLGCSLTSIAMEKGGIIKSGKPVVLGDSKPEVVDAIRRISQVRGSPLILSAKEATISDLESDISGSHFVLSTSKNEYKISTSLAGKFQIKNVTNAVLAIEQMENLRITRGQIEKGVAATRWPGRMEIIRKDPILMVDCAHNPPAANALAQAFSEFHLPEPTLVIGMLSDKDIYSFLHAARKISSRVIFTIPDEPQRAVPPEKLAEIGTSIFTEVKIIHDPVEAYRSAMESSPVTLVMGSMYLVGVVMAREGTPVIPFHDD